VRPDRLFVGWKDYQQVVLLRQMVHDLAMPVEVIGVPTVREVDGLAMSSRNRYLTPTERQQAVGLHQALEAAQAAWRQGERRAEPLLGCARRVLASFAIREIDYVELRDAGTLAPWPATPGQVSDTVPVMLIAARVGAARLIDNRVFFV
ncbi:MAG: pantoate--beta-alanine ligase, partial [Magnetococcus sp. DMHC-8]